MTTREVVLDGGSPWGFRLHGGADTNQPLRISRVNPGSKAALRGIREGDFITSINGKSTKDISNAEAHSLLKNSGDTLKLGLNEDQCGSPKRRQYKTLHQETHSETVKRSSTTSYTLTSSKTVVQTEQANNDPTTSNKNGNTTNGNSVNNRQPPAQEQINTNPFLSPASTLSSQTSTQISEEGGQNPCDKMPETKSKRKRSRNQRKKNKNNSVTVQVIVDESIVGEEKAPSNKTGETSEKKEYRVESPKLDQQEKCSKSEKKPVKSKSLDDDEMVKIQELSETSECEDNSSLNKIGAECKAIVSEAESEEWEEARDLENVDEELEKEADMGSISLSLDLDNSANVSEVSLISPEEELTLRNFLQGLNLVNSPEDAVKQVKELSTSAAINSLDSIKARRAKKRQAIEQYFFPICQNPRYLDVINEENSDLSDKEQQAPDLFKQHLKQGTPELEIVDKPPPLPPRRYRRLIAEKKEENPTILVGTKLVEPETLIKHVETSQQAEVVFLEEVSSGSSTPDPKSDGEDLVQESGVKSAEVLSSANSSAPELSKKEYEEEVDKKSEETEKTEMKQQVQITVKKNNQITSQFNVNEEFTQTNSDLSFQLTPPPTPENMSPKCENYKEIDSLAQQITKDLSEDNHPAIRQIAQNQSKFKSLPSELQNIIDTYLKTKEENEEIKEILQTTSDEENKTFYLNVVSPPVPSPSPSLSSGSSRGTSLCTIKLNSSIADITSITKDEEFGKSRELPSLREICLNYLMTQPFGVDVLQELAEVSQSLQNLTNNLPGQVLSTTNPLQQPSQAAFHNNNEFDNDAINDSDNVIPVDVETNSEMNWVGLPTRDNSKILICLSPKQRQQLDKSRQIKNEGEKLLDMHTKYFNRSKFDMTTNEEKVDESVEVTFINNNKIEGEEAAASSDDANKMTNRLLAIIRDEPDRSDRQNEAVAADAATLPKNFKLTNEIDNVMESARLNAKDLGEWLQLARISSESNLSNCGFTNNTNSYDDGDWWKFGGAGTAKKEHRAKMSRRTSLPQEYLHTQMVLLMEKEREIQKELEQLEEEKRKLQWEMAPTTRFRPDDYKISRRGDFAENRRPVSMPPQSTSASEYFRQQMYEEYMGKVAQREERKQLKVIKVTCTSENSNSNSKNINTGIEDEFMVKVKEKQKMGKLQLKENGTCEENYQENDEIQEDCDAPVLVMDGEKLKGADNLPKHLQEFVDITKTASAENSTNASVAENSSSRDGVWSPGQKHEFKLSDEPAKKQPIDTEHKREDEPISPIWTPKSATSSPVVERKEFRPVRFESPVLSRKNYSSEGSEENISKEPPWKHQKQTSSDSVAGQSSTLQKRLPTSHSAPASGFNNEFSTPPTRLPRVQNPTITLLQKAREGQLPKGALYIEQQEHQQKRSQNDRPPLIGPGEVLYKIKNEYTSESDSEKPKKMADLSSRKFEGIGPTTRDGMPVILRSEVKDANQSKWYKRMYDTIHKQKPHRDEYVTVRYKQRRAQHPYTSGYLSEPEPGAASYYSDSDFTDYSTKYATLDRRRTPSASGILQNSNKENDYYYNMSSTMPRTSSVTDNNAKVSEDVVKHGHESYRNQPGRIENYVPGHSSISDKEAKEFWDEVMDIFDGWLDDNSALPSYDYMFARALARSQMEKQKRVPPQNLAPFSSSSTTTLNTHQSKSFINQALKESGYESDSTLVFRRRDDTAQQLSPLEQKEVYKVIQKGGDIPLHGLRKPAPERPKADLVHLDFFKPLKIQPPKEIFCYPVTIHPSPSSIFATYKRTAPSPIPNIPIPPPMPPSPPRRRSSRNNSTLRLISTLKVKTTTSERKSPMCKRHETCFTTTASTSASNNAKVKYLRDKITCKLQSPSNKGASKDRKIRVTKATSSAPDLRSKLVSTLCTSRDGKTVARKANLGTIKKKSSSTTNLNRETNSAFRTFGSEKRKVDIVLPKVISKADKKFVLPNSPELLSPTEVKKVVQQQTISLPPGTVYKKSSGMLASAKNSPTSSYSRTTIPIKVGISERGKNLLKIRKSPSPSPSTSKIKSSTESLKSPTTAKKIISTVGRSRSKPSKTVDNNSISSGKKLKKAKKEEINGAIAKKSEKVKCASRATGTEIVKKMREIETEDEFGSNSTLAADIQKQREAVQSDYFFQHLFLRDLPSPTPSVMSRNSWILEKTHQLQNRRRSLSGEPTIGAMKVYLKHTRPVSDSKFKTLDMIYARSRSASPKFVTFSSKTSEKPPTEKRSSSLPPKLVFSQTTRPVSPKVEKGSFTPPISPRPIRSPSSRRIMQFKNQPQTIDRLKDDERNKQLELSLYTCPSLSHSASSIDSSLFGDRKDYKEYFSDLKLSKPKSSKFKDLNDFYSAIEKYGKLEQTTSASNYKPRRRCEDEIIDYDRWREVRTREKAEKELESLVVQLKENEKEKGFLFAPKAIGNYRWRREMDRGLRIKEKSVDNIKEEFERLKHKQVESDKKLERSKDTYKPLWRGDSVINLANRMVEKRAHSEGRPSTLSTRQKLINTEKMLTHGIGSRLWSSLSSEQVNILKNQLTEIYGQHFVPPNKEQRQNEDYSIQVSKDKQYQRPQTLTVRRNSADTSLYKNENSMSETDKKILSQTLSREVLDHVTKRRGDNPSLVLAKETRGAFAAAEALDSMTRSCPAEILTEPALVKTNAITSKLASASETDSTDESSKTIIYAGDNKEEIKKKVEYFENVKAEEYTPTVYKAAEKTLYDDFPNENIDENSEARNESNFKRKPITSHSYQDLKEFFGEKELMRIASVPLSETRKEEYQVPATPPLRIVGRLREPSPPISETTSIDSFYRSRSLSPYFEAPPVVKTGKVRKLKTHFDSNRRPIKRSTSDTNLDRFKQICIPGQSFGDVATLKNRYEYPAHAGRGRSRVRRGGVVSPTFLRAEDRFMPHINIISKIANLYTRKPDTREKSQSAEDLAKLLGCPIGEVEKMKQKFDGSNISLLGHMFTSSPNIKELRDIAPYLAASWYAHKYPKSEDNTRSLSSPECSMASRDVSLLKRTKSLHQRPKSTSPPRSKQHSSILKSHHRGIDTKMQPISRYQPEPIRYKSWWRSCSTHSTKPSVSFKDPEPPVPPPKGHHALRNLQAESPRKYVENEVTIHYKTPIRQEIKEHLSEDELAYRQAETMKKIYQEERRRKYLQELQDMNSRRHTDNFIPSQKSPIPLNRYDDFDDLHFTAKRAAINQQPQQPTRSPEPRLLAKALYNFVGQTSRELTFRKGDLIYVRRQVDKNWYEGELNAMVGLFPVNYVEIVTHDAASKPTPRKSHEGQARAKYNFVAQTHLELSLAKGELVIITRRVDDNWFEGKIGGRKGIFPVSYVEVLIDPNDHAVQQSTKPVAAPAAHSLLLNGSAGGKESMGSHSYTPNVVTSSNQLTTSYHAKPVQVINTTGTTSASYGSLNRNGKNSVNQALHIETSNEPVPYRAMYKYLPQNDDELELLEGDTVYVLEKCDDGWYVGSSERTGAFGTFPGNYVEKI